MASQNKNTVATQAFKTVTTTQIMDPNYNRSILFHHSICLFLLSYPEFDETMLDHPVYGPKFREFLAVIQDLYSVEIRDQLMGSLDYSWKLCKRRYIAVIFTIKRFKGRENAPPMMNVVCGNKTTGTRALPVIYLKDTDIQLDALALMRYTFDELRQVRRDNNRLEVYIAVSGRGPESSTQGFIPFDIEINRIHPEGFEQWIDFGRGISLLVEISFKVVPDPNDPKLKEPKNFHMHTLCRMMQKRLKVSTFPEEWHRFKINNIENTFERPAIEPNSDQMFWRTGAPFSLEKLREWTEMTDQERQGKTIPTASQVVSQKIYFFDLQKGLPYSEDLIEKVCLCNEWCNWNSFFHYNPIYRFIIVQNSQIFFDFIGGVPDIYLFCCALLSFQNMPRVGRVCRLLKSANDYRHRHIHQFFFKKARDFYKRYPSSYPDVIVMSAVTYNILRYHLPIAQLSLQLHVNPSADICVKNLLDYNTVLTQFHHFVSIAPHLVEPDNKHSWMEELEPIIHEKITDFFRMSYDKIFQTVHSEPPIDHLFGSDEEYLNYVTGTEGQRYVKALRMRAIRWGRTAYSDTNDIPTDFNALNVTVLVNNFLEAFIWSYKFVLKIRPKFPSAYHTKGFEAIDKMYRNFDFHFRRFYDILNPQDKNEMFEVADQELMTNRVPIDMRYHIYSFYTLKLYSFGFVLQRQCIDARYEELCSQIRRQALTIGQISDMFDFIADNNVLEQTFRSQFPNQSLFPLNTQRTRQLFDSFYNQFWTRAPHEIIDAPDYVMSVVSALQQYRKLFVWMRNDGNYRPRFTIILTHYRNELRLSYTRADQILRAMIAPACAWLYQVHWTGLDSDDNIATETMDVLCLYAVRAACYCLISTVFALFNQIHSIVETQALVDTFRAFNMYKPGWVPLFLTINEVAEELDRIIASFAVYDDELERIGRTVVDTWTMIKKIYDTYYYKVCFQWNLELSLVKYNCKQLTRIGIQLTTADQKAIGDLMELQVMFGISLMARFHRLFRKTFHALRKYHWEAFGTTFGNEPYLYRIWNILFPAIQYLENNSDAIREADPTTCAVWLPLLQQNHPDIFNLQPSDVQLDMNQANIQM